MFLASVDLNKILISDKMDFYYIINQYITSHLSDSLSVNELARVVHLQPNYFINKFKSSFGATPTDYINTLRLDAAVKELTAHPQKNIEAIALQLGYHDYRYFDRIFKKRYGVTPSTIRRLKEGNI